MKFQDYRIAEGIKKSISKQGFKKPTDIQYKAIPPILKGDDVLAIAQTGTGKTAAFVIPVLHLLSLGIGHNLENLVSYFAENCSIVEKAHQYCNAHNLMY